jgi:hypothetical protein
LKVDTGASVSLAHPDYLTDIKDCRFLGMHPVRLNGIGGNTGTMYKVGILNIIPQAGASPQENLATKIKCYSFDSPIGDTTHLALISTYIIDKIRVDQRYHTYTSLRKGPQPLRLISIKPPKAARLQNRAPRVP